MSDASATRSPAMPIESGRASSFSGKDVMLYGMMIIVWGSSWIAMSHQVGIVPPIVTGVYRFGLAALAMFLWAIVGKYPLRFPLHIHMRFLLQGIFIFSSNFVLFYYAAGYMASGLLAVIFSTASLINIAMAAVFLRQRPHLFGILGALLGFAGIALIFWPQIAENAGNEGILIGLGFGLAGTFSFCTGNMLSLANKKYNLPLVSTNAWGMLYGALWLIMLTFILDVPFVVDDRGQYWIAMTWLVLMSSVAAFWGYMTLLNSIGPARAGYLTVLFPIVALLLSTIFEDYHWTLSGLLGLAAIILGNILVMRKSRS